MKYLLTFLTIWSNIIYGQHPLNKSLFEHNTICQQIKLHQDTYYVKVVNDYVYYYNKIDGKYIKEIKGIYPKYDSLAGLSTYMIKSGQGIMVDLSKGYTCYTYYDWKNYYRAKLSITNDSGRTWRELIDFDKQYSTFFHKNEHIFIIDEQTIIVYGMRTKFVLKDVYMQNKVYSAVNLDNIELSCLPNRDGYVNVDRFKKIQIDNFLYISNDAGQTWKEASIPQWFKSGFNYDNHGDNTTYRGSLKANMVQNKLIWFERKNGMLIITTKQNNRELRSKDGGFTWR
jgi:hypothetical protein